MFGMEIKDVEMLKGIFEELDVTKDGNIDRNELKQALEKAVYAHATPPAARAANRPCDPTPTVPLRHTWRVPLSRARRCRRARR